MSVNKEKWKSAIKKTLQFFFNPRFLLCFGLGWIVTNGWSYILMALGMLFEIEWMIWVSGAYLTFLWLPISPEKIVTVAIAVFLLKWFFPNDTKTLGVLLSLRDKFRQKRKAKADAKENPPQ